MKRFLAFALAALLAVAAFAADEPQGNVASGASDVGRPLKIGGVYNSTLPTFTTGQRGDIQLGSRGSLNVTLMGANGTQAVGAGTGADGTSSAAVGGYAVTLGHVFNGTTYDRVRGNIDTGALITASAATTTQTAADQTNYNGRCVKVVLDMTSAGTGSVTLAIQGKDTASGKYYALLTGAAVTTVTTNVYEVCPGVTVTANVSASTALPRTWRVVVTANNANATTYTVGASVTQ